MTIAAAALCEVDCPVQKKERKGFIVSRFKIQENALVRTSDPVLGLPALAVYYKEAMCKLKV